MDQDNGRPSFRSLQPHRNPHAITGDHLNSRHARPTGRRGFAYAHN